MFLMPVTHFPLHAVDPPPSTPVLQSGVLLINNSIPPHSPRSPPSGWAHPFPHPLLHIPTTPLLRIDWAYCKYSGPSPQPSFRPYMSPIPPSPCLSSTLAGCKHAPYISAL